MKEHLISYKIAKLAKEKGFNIEINQYWCNGIISDNFQQNVDWNNIAESHISAPTQSLLQKWLREKHNISILIFSYLDGKLNAFEIVDINKCINEFDIIHKQLFDTYEKALEQALKEALNNINN